MSAQLFTPLTVGTTTFAHRVWIAAMCQYSVTKQDGVPTDWHLVHLGQLATGRPGLIITEATAVSPEGRISPQDTGIWNEQQAEAWQRITAFIRDQGVVPGIQLAHAGRKASTYPAWGTQNHGAVPIEDGGWEVVGPSAEPFNSSYAVPRALDAAGIDKVVTDFAEAAGRAVAAGFEVLELHAAHGYLLHQFLSPLSNHRTDEYGGELAGRARLLLRVVDAVRERAPRTTLFVRFSATDWTPGGLTEDEVAIVAGWAREHGADLFDISTGGNVAAKIPLEPGYQVRFAEHVRTAAGVPVGAVGLITDAHQAEEIVAGGRADAVLIAREALRDPHTPIRWARELGADDTALWVPQYERARPR